MDSVTLLPPDDRPLYQRVRDQIRTGLENGVWKPGDLLPTEVELGERFGVSTGTVRHSVLELVRDGFLTRRAGRGTFVARLDRERSLTRWFRFREEGSSKDFAPVIRVIAAEVLRCPSAEVARNLRISRNQKVLFLRRVMMQDETPVCLYASYLPYWMVPGLESKTLCGVLYQILEREFGIHVVRAEEYLRAGAADPESAELFDMPEGLPVILIERTAFTYQDTVVEWRKTVGRSDRFHYKIQLR